MTNTRGQRRKVKKDVLGSRVDDRSELIISIGILDTHTHTFMSSKRCGKLSGSVSYTARICCKVYTGGYYY